MTIALARDVEAFLQEQVRDGACADASELVNDVIRLLRDQTQRSIDITPKLEAWLLEAADRPVTPLTSDDFAGIKMRVRARAARDLAPRQATAEAEDATLVNAIARAAARSFAS